MKLFELQFNKQIAFLLHHMRVRMCVQKKNNGPTGKRYEIDLFINAFLYVWRVLVHTIWYKHKQEIILLPTVDTLTKYIQKICSTLDVCLKRLKSQEKKRINGSWRKNRPNINRRSQAYEKSRSK